MYAKWSRNNSEKPRKPEKCWKKNEIKLRRKIFVKNERWQTKKPIIREYDGVKLINEWTLRRRRRRRK